jgi:hypothetical protein
MWLLPHTRRSYRDGVLSFVRHRGIVWPQEAPALLTISVADVQTYRDVLAAIGAAEGASGAYEKQAGLQRE